MVSTPSSGVVSKLILFGFSKSLGSLTSTSLNPKRWVNRQPLAFSIFRKINFLATLSLLQATLTPLDNPLSKTICRLVLPVISKFSHIPRVSLSLHIRVVSIFIFQVLFYNLDYSHKMFIAATITCLFAFSASCYSSEGIV